MALLKLIACEIAAREFCHVAAQARNCVDLEFLPQGFHDTPAAGRRELQTRIDAVPVGECSAILLGYGLCSCILTGLRTAHTPLVIPRAHDCITLFLGSKERYRQTFDANPGTYYYTSGWLECARRRGGQGSGWSQALSPAGSNANLQATYEEWVRKYGEDQARYLLGELSRWTESYTRGLFIHFDFLRHLKLAGEARAICAERGWGFEETEGNLSLLQRLVDGDWPEPDFLVVPPGHEVVATYDEKIIGARVLGA